MARVHVLHENDEWVAPLRDELTGQCVPFTEWFMDAGQLDLSRAPPEGVFYNRMSASSHTRGHRYAAEYTAAVLEWLANHRRRVINPRRALALEVSKVAQYSALNAHGIRTPHTVAAVGRDAILAAADQFSGQFIVKHNRAGKGLGVRLCEDRDDLAGYLTSDAFQPPVDGILLLQQYIEAPAPFVTRCEFVAGEFLYAVRVDTSEGFELCPADSCATDDGLCPATVAATDKFRIDRSFHTPLLDDYRRFLAANDVQIAGIEFIVDHQGRQYTYDINTNTNYKAAAEAVAGVSGMGAIASYLAAQLAVESARLPLAAAG